VPPHDNERFGRAPGFASFGRLFRCVDYALLMLAACR
jgi:hypothetical protein